MRVLHCITGLSGDGAQRMLLRLAVSMRELGVVSAVVNLGSEPGVSCHFEQAGLAVHSLNITPTAWSAMLGIRRLRGIIDKEQPDIIQGWMYHANALASCARIGRNTKASLVWNIRRGLDDYAERKLKTRSVIRSNALLSKIADGIIYCSPESRSQHESLGFYVGRGAVIGNGFDTHKFKPQPDKRREFRRQHSIGDEEIVIGNIGRFDLAKGHSFLVRAFARVVAHRPEVRLVLIGRGVDDFNENLVSLLAAEGCRERVILLGEQESVENLLPGFDIYCSSSISEGFPNALSEAMASEITCVTTDTGASAQLVQGIGRVVPPRCALSLADALLETIAKGAHFRETAGVLGRERIVQHYGLPSVAKRYFDLYAETLGEGRRA